MPFGEDALAGLGAGAQAIGSFFSNKSAKRAANRQMEFQRQQQRQQFAQTSALSDRQMEFQERMSNTSYQRAMQDLKLAGLNPILAYSQGGAATPSGAGGAGGAPGGGSSYRPENVFSGGASSAMDYKRMLADIENIKAQTKLTRENTNVAKTNAVMNVNSARKIAAETARPEAEGRIYTGLNSAMSRLQKQSFIEELKEFGRNIKRGGY